MHGIKLHFVALLILVLRVTDKVNTVLSICILTNCMYCTVVRFTQHVLSTSKLPVAVLLLLYKYHQRSWGTAFLVVIDVNEP